MNDRIPFEKDILRYGGNKRESKTQFWIDLLDEFGLNYHVVKETSIKEQCYEVGLAVLNDFRTATTHIREYKR
jgi:hypothetical protein